MALDFADNFAARQLAVTSAGRLDGTNVGATLELNEPRHGGRPGNHSVWIAWRAPQDGIVTFDTRGSSFDTLISAYVVEPGSKPPLEQLREVARGDDEKGDTYSVLQFGVTSGTTYEIAIAGYNNASGAIRFNWDFTPSDEPPPIFLMIPEDRSLQVGEALTLKVDYQAGKSVKLNWFFNGNELPNQEAATLVIPNFQPQNVGIYTLRFTADKIRFFTRPIEIQINSEGLTTTLARNKLLDASDSGLKGGDDGPGRAGPSVKQIGRGRPLLQGPGAGVARGYNGTQIFNSVFASRDPAEPIHCGIPGGGSYWFAYQAPTNGILTLDTTGSAFDTVLAVYTYDTPVVSYQDLREVTCNNDAGADLRTSQVQFRAESGRSYLVVVDGVNGARGLVYLNYVLNVAQEPGPVPPRIVNGPTGITVAVGFTATLTAQATGTPPLRYRWYKDQSPLPAQTADTLSWVGITAEHAGFYQVEVANDSGKVLSEPVPVVVWSPPEFVWDALHSFGLVRFTAAGPLQFGMEFSPQIGGPWQPWPELIRPTNGVVQVPIAGAHSAALFVRIRLGSPAGP